MIRPGKLHHSSLSVSDFEKSKKFYEDLLGFRPLPRPDFPFAGAWYELGQGQLHLIQQDAKMGGSIDPTDPHIAVEVEDYEATKQVLRERGIEFLELGPQLWIKDPDGNTVELRQRA